MNVQIGHLCDSREMLFVSPLFNYTCFEWYPYLRNNMKEEFKFAKLNFLKFIGDQIKFLKKMVRI